MVQVQVGQTAPDFKSIAVVDGRFKEIALSSYIEAKHWLILIFFPKAWSFICPTEIKAFSARLDDFLYKRSCAVVFCSTDNEHCLKAWNATGDMDGGLGGVHVPLMSDCNHKISSDFGVLIEDNGVAQRALFIIDPKGRLRNITVNDADVGRSVDEAQRVLDALIFKDEFGEGCPVDWKKGDPGIDIQTKTNVGGEFEVPKRISWTKWARPQLHRAWSGTSAQSISSNMPAAASSNEDGQGNGNERTRKHSNMNSTSTGGSVSRSPFVSLAMHATGISQIEGPMEAAIHLQKNTEAAVENMRAAAQHHHHIAGFAI